MDFEDEFDVNGKRVTTYLTRSVEGINSVLEFIFRNSISEVIGLEICKSVIHLCDEYTCIIIPLLHLNSIPESLTNFLGLSDYTFVGVGIMGKLEKLEKQFGIRCRNVVELGQLAASVLDMPYLKTCGVDELARVVIKFDLRRSVMSGLYGDSGGDVLSSKQAEFATVNVYSCYQIGRKLLARKKPRSPERCQPEIRRKNVIGSFVNCECLGLAVFLLMIFLIWNMM